MKYENTFSYLPLVARVKANSTYLSQDAETARSLNWKMYTTKFVLSLTVTYLDHIGL